MIHLYSLVDSVDKMSSPDLIHYLEGETMFLREKIYLSFVFHKDLWIVKCDSGEKSFDIIFESEEDFKKGIEMCKEILFEETSCSDIPHFKERTTDDIETYTSEEFFVVIERLVDDLQFKCELCVSTTGGYRQFFHCLQCLLEGESFSVCHSCIEENEVGWKEHQSDFPDHLIEHSSNYTILKFYIDSVE